MWEQKGSATGQNSETISGIIHKMKVLAYLEVVANLHTDFVQVGFRNIEIKEVRCYEVVQVVGLIEMYQRVNQSARARDRA